MQVIRYIFNKIFFYKQIRMKENLSQTKQSNQSQHQQSKHIKDTKHFKILLDMQDYFKNNIKMKLSQRQYNVFSIIDKNDPDRVYFTKALNMIFSSSKQNKSKQANNLKLDKSALNLQPKIQRAVACFLGLAIGDALGSCTQFSSFKKDQRNRIKFDFKDAELYSRQGAHNIWTDDCSMALSLADSLLLNNFKLNPKHSRYMYQMWLHHGLNNGGRKYSIGLGGNISISTYQFEKSQQDYTQEGNKFNNGNGSLMRLAPIPVNFYYDQQQAMKASEQQSRTTHNGDQAKQCCRLLTLILVRLINRDKFEWKDVIQKACADFKTQSKSVEYLAKSQQQPHQFYQEQAKAYKNFVRFNRKLSDRNWNWKDTNYTYSQSRADSMPGYVGSYCMDALSMALHTVWYGTSYHEITLKNANMGGDCDTVGAIAGQLAGAIYGIDSGMLHLYSQMQDAISGRFEVFLKAYKLATKHQVPIS